MRRLRTGKGIFAALYLDGAWRLLAGGAGRRRGISDFDKNARVNPNRTRSFAFIASDEHGNRGLYTRQLGFYSVDTEIGTASSTG